MLRVKRQNWCVFSKTSSVLLCRFLWINMSGNLFLSFSVLKSFPQNNAINHYPNLGDSVTLRCVPPQSLPEPDVYWATYRENEGLTPIYLTDRVSIDPQGEYQDQMAVDCFTLLLARHLADVSCFIGPSMPSEICMEIHTKIVQKRKKKQSRDEGIPRQSHVYL